MKQTPVVKIPKGSRFLSLRHKLPTSFEWIKARKRLIHETAIQHHCVWSYAKVNYHTPPKGGMWLSLNGLPD